MCCLEEYRASLSRGGERQTNLMGGSLSMVMETV